MRKASTSPPSETEEDDLLPEYRFDYRHAKPNRFAGEAAWQKKGERSAITGRFVKPSATKGPPKTTVTETVKASSKGPHRTVKSPAKTGRFSLKAATKAARAVRKAKAAKPKKSK